MLERLDLRGFEGDLRSRVAPSAGRASSKPDDDLRAVREILDEVARGGDEALRDLTERFDGCRPTDLRVPVSERARALSEASSELRAALEFARDRITAHHENQRVAPDPVESDLGITISDVVVPLGIAGCYVPGGRAAYPSTVLMTALPARVAGVDTVVLCVPPGPDGRVPDATLAAAALAEVDDVFCVGGAQAIGALALGTDTVPAVDVIVGPGNRFVALAKREVAGRVRTDTFAGPSELVVIADGSADPAYVATDLLAQAEHGPGGLAALVTWDPAVADSVDRELESRASTATRSDDIGATLAEGGRAVLVDDATRAVAVSDAVAPEHLELMVEAPAELLALVRNAGAVFCGASSPAAVGDYVAGVNHVLPTGGTARFADALRVSDFLKHIHVVDATPDALEYVRPHIEALARAEGLDAHAASVAVRASNGKGAVP
ncbi:MAG: histidinol dehydrogenase [Acidimicrobiia bacterium]